MKIDCDCVTVRKYVAWFLSLHSKKKTIYLKKKLDKLKMRKNNSKLQKKEEKKREKKAEKIAQADIIISKTKGLEVIFY